MSINKPRRCAESNRVALCEGYGSVEVTHKDGCVQLKYNDVAWMTAQQARRLALVLSEHANALEAQEIKP